MGAEWDKKLEPMPGKIILRFEEPEDKFAPDGLIYVPDTHKHDRDEAEVLAVGPGKHDQNGNYMQCPVNVGDRVISSSVWGKQYRYFDADNQVRKVVIVGYNDIIAKVKS